MGHPIAPRSATKCTSAQTTSASMSVKDEERRRNIAAVGTTVGIMAMITVETMVEIAVAITTTGKGPPTVIPSPGRDRDKLREESLFDLSRRKERFLGTQRASE